MVVERFAVDSRTPDRLAVAQTNNYSTAVLLSWIAFSLGYVNRPHTECIMNIIKPKVAVTKFRTSDPGGEKFNLSSLVKPESPVKAGQRSIFCYCTSLMPSTVTCECIQFKYYLYYSI